MTRTRLNKVIWITVLGLILYGVMGAYLFSKHYDTWYIFYKDMISVAIAIPGAYLVFCFQRRSSFLQALRELWLILIPSIQSAIQYTHLSNPGESEYSVVNEKVSAAIDSIRGVFTNMKASGHPTGLFPFENLKDISKVLDWLNPKDNKTDNERALARKCIVNLWQEMYKEMLKEFDRSPPIHGVSKYLFPESTSVADLLIENQLNKDDLEKDVPASHPRS